MAKIEFTAETLNNYVDEMLEQMESDFESVGATDAEVREATVLAMWLGVAKIDRDFIWSLHHVLVKAWTDNLYGKVDKRNTVLYVLIERLAKVLRETDEK